MYVCGEHVCISYTGAHLRYDITMQLLYLCIFDENKVVFLPQSWKGCTDGSVSLVVGLSVHHNEIPPQLLEALLEHVPIRLSQLSLTLS